MRISIDYDDTYTRDPAGWDAVIRLLRSRQHKVYVVTWRHESECNEVYCHLGDRVDGVYPTGRLAKQPFMFAQGICIDVWVDDNPSAILHSMEGHYAT